MTLREHVRLWVGADKPRAVPRRINPKDSVTVIIPGGVANTTAADEFSNDIAKWRKGEGVLYIPEGSRIELTRR